MKNVKAPTSDSYQDYLISRLKDPTYAALYLETHIEEEEDNEPELLRLALRNVLQALSSSKMTFDQAEFHHQKLDEILSQPGSLAIYGLASWLNELGLKLTVAVPDQNLEKQ
jgi:DNA-binding phage protein